MHIEADPLSTLFIYKNTRLFIPPMLTMSPNRLHQYAYVSNNALRFIDPYGLLDLCLYKLPDKKKMDKLPDWNWLHDTYNFLDKYDKLTIPNTEDIPGEIKIDVNNVKIDMKNKKINGEITILYKLDF